MSKSVRARAMSSVLEVFSVYTEKNSEKMIENAIAKGESPTPSPKILETRYVDNEYGRVFYLNEESDSKCTVFYIHGGAYFMDINTAHWRLIKKLVKEANAEVIVPAYRLLPFATYKEAFNLIVPLYKEYCDKHSDKKIILMGDSAGGGLSLALTESFKIDGICVPDELVLLSPWVDISMENEEISNYEDKDPFLSVNPLKICAKEWANDIDVQDWHVSPIYGDLKGIKNVTVFVGTDGILYPDIVKFFGMLDKDSSNELIVGEEMNHVYPLFPIPEAKPAVEKILEVVRR